MRVSFVKGLLRESVS